MATSLPKPQIIRELMFRHREQPTESSSEASFLKLSQKNSQDLEVLAEQAVFQEMQKRLQALENKQINKIKKISREIKSQMDHRSQRLSLSNNPIGENKENIEIAFRNVQGHAYQEQQLIEDGNFQMDEHRNYVKHGADFVKMGENMKEMPSKQRFLQRLSVSQNEYNHTPRKTLDSCKSSNSNSKAKRRTTITTCKDETKRGGRVYEEILSLYSTAKLLALEKKYH